MGYLLGESRGANFVPSSFPRERRNLDAQILRLARTLSARSTGWNADCSVASLHQPGGHHMRYAVAGEETLRQQLEQSRAFREGLVLH